MVVVFHALGGLVGRGSYLGGGSVVGFGGSFTGTRNSKLVRSTEIDPHLTQKKGRDDARNLATKPKKDKKSAPKQVGKGPNAKVVSTTNRPKPKSKGPNFAKKIAGAECDVHSIERDIEKAKRHLWALERDLHRARVAVSEAQNLRRTAQMAGGKSQPVKLEAKP